MSCFVSLFQTNKHHAPFLSFLLDICESWSLAEGEEQSSHHEATSARSVHRLCNCWVSCVRSADAAKWKAMEFLFFFYFFIFFLFLFCYRTPNMFRVCWGRERGQKEKSQTAILSDNWNVGLTFGESSPRCKETVSSTIGILLLLEEPTGLRVFCEVQRSKWICFCLKCSYDAEIHTRSLSCLKCNRSQLLQYFRSSQGKKNKTIQNLMFYPNVTATRQTRPRL